MPRVGTEQLRDTRRRFLATLGPTERRGVGVLAWISCGALVAVTVTGLWQFVAHRPDPAWYDYSPGTDLRPQPSASEGMAAAHAFAADVTTAVALFGGAWFAYKVVFRIPRVLALAVGLAVTNLITGSLIRFNAVKLSGRALDEAGDGYLQLFVNRVEYVVTDKQTFGPLAIRILTLTHVLAVPILLAVAWLAIGRADDESW